MLNRSQVCVIRQSESWIGPNVYEPPSNYIVLMYTVANRIGFLVTMFKFYKKDLFTKNVVPK